MRKGTLLVLGIISIILMLSPGTANAIPAFARREGVPCQMCHFRMPELREDGYAYLRRGLREEPMEPMAASTSPAGPTAPMPGGEQMKTPAGSTSPLLGTPLNLQWAKYLSVMGHHDLVIQRGSRATFDAGAVDIWVGGPFDRHWSALANPSFDIENGGSSVDVAYGQYITKWAEQFGSVRFGQTMPFAILFHQGGPSMPLSTPVVLSTPPDTGTSWTPTTLLRGVEFGFVNLPRWNAYLGVGQPHLEDTSAADESNRHTDFYGSAEYLFDPSGSSLALYGYRGEASVAPNGADRSFHRIGLFSNLFWPKTKGVFGFVTGSDEADDGRSLDNNGLFVLGERLLSERWAAYARYDWLRQDLSAGGAETITGPTLGVSWWAATPIRLTLEGQILNATGQPQARSLSMEFLWIF